MDRKAYIDSGYVQVLSITKRFVEMNYKKGICKRCGVDVYAKALAWQTPLFLFFLILSCVLLCITYLLREHAISTIFFFSACISFVLSSGPMHMNETFSRKRKEHERICTLSNQSE